MGKNSTLTRGAVVAVTAAITTLAACAGDDNDAGEQAAQDQTAEAAATAAPAAGPVEGGDAAIAAQTDLDLGTIGLDVIVEMHVVLASEDIERSVAAITAEASALGGGIASSDVDFGAATDDGVAPSGHAVLVVKVPPTAVNRLIDGLDATGDVRSIDQSAQDVTDQLVDLEVRISNARTSVENVRAFMDRTQNLSELVSLEAELTRRQTELEQLEAQQRNLEDRVALATVTIEVVPVPPATELQEPDAHSIGDAFADGLDAFFAVLFAIGFVLAAAAPFLVIGLLVTYVAWRVSRRRTETDVPVTRQRDRRHDDDRVSERERVSTSQRE